MILKLAATSATRGGPLTRWHDDHVNFGRLLTLLEREMDSFHEGGQPNYDLMRDVLQYLRWYPDLCHHPREDIAFAMLAGRAPQLEAVVTRLQQEHRVIASAGETLLERLQAASEGVLIRRDTVEAPAATYLVYYRHHLATEEREILPRAALLLAPEDWAQVAAAIPAGIDPLFGPNPEQRYAELRAHIDLEALAGARDE